MLLFKSFERSVFCVIADAQKLIFWKGFISKWEIYCETNYFTHTTLYNFSKNNEERLSVTSDFSIWEIETQNALFFMP